LSRLYGLSPSSIEVVHNGVDLSVFRDPPAPTLRQELGLSGETRIVLVLARLQPNKGHRYLIEAAPTILERCPVHFVFAGSPDERANLDARIAELGLSHSVSILGHRTDVLNLLRASDVFVLPSLAEGFALSIIEALAAGLPVVATRVGGAAEIIRNGENGFLVEPGDSVQLAAAVQHALGLDPDTHRRLREAALATAALFSCEETARHMVELYRHVQQHPAHPPRSRSASLPGG